MSPISNQGIVRSHGISQYYHYSSLFIVLLYCSDNLVATKGYFHVVRSVGYRIRF
jgi:hypothetical protein